MDNRSPGPLALLRDPGLPEVDLTVRVIAREGQDWLYTYPRPADVSMPADDTCQTSGLLVLPAGREVRLLLVSHDTVHPWSVPALGIETAALPGRVEEIVVHSSAMDGGAPEAAPTLAEATQGPHVRFMPAMGFAAFKREVLPAGC